MAKRGRRPAIPDDELKELVFDAAAALLEEHGGLSLSPEVVGFEEVIQRAGVSRSAVYRLWPQKELFLNDLLERLAAPGWEGTAAFDKETQDMAANIVFADEARLRTKKGRREAISEAVRVAALHNFEALTRDHRWRNYTALAVTITGVQDEEARDRLLRELRRADLEFRDMMEEFYRGMVEVLHMTPRPPFDDENACAMLTTMGASLVEGLALHSVVDETVATARLDLGGDEWSLPALGFLAMVDLIFVAG